jgi:hypothetical protein
MNGQARVSREAPGEGIDHGGIEFDGVDLRALLKEELRERTAARADFDDCLRIGGKDRVGNPLEDGAAGEEVLAETASQS